MNDIELKNAASTIHSLAQRALQGDLEGFQVRAHHPKYPTTVVGKPMLNRVEICWYTPSTNATHSNTIKGFILPDRELGEQLALLYIDRREKYDGHYSLINSVSKALAQWYGWTDSISNLMQGWGLPSGIRTVAFLSIFIEQSEQAIDGAERLRAVFFIGENETCEIEISRSIYSGELQPPEMTLEAAIRNVRAPIVRDPSYIFHLLKEVAGQFSWTERYVYYQFHLQPSEAAKIAELEGVKIQPCGYPLLGISIGGNLTATSGSLGPILALPEWGTLLTEELLIIGSWLPDVWPRRSSRAEEKKGDGQGIVCMPCQNLFREEGKQ